MVRSRTPKIIYAGPSAADIAAQSAAQQAQQAELQRQMQQQFQGQLTQIQSAYGQQFAGLSQQAQQQQQQYQQQLAAITADQQQRQQQAEQQTALIDQLTKASEQQTSLISSLQSNSATRNQETRMNLIGDATRLAQAQQQRTGARQQAAAGRGSSGIANQLSQILRNEQPGKILN